MRCEPRFNLCLRVTLCSFRHGWVTFCVALAYIGLVTAMIGDLASLMGCTMGLSVRGACVALFFFFFHNQCALSLLSFHLPHPNSPLPLSQLAPHRAVPHQDTVTAITFVALGTSLPDTFASRSAAIASSTADAAITNVTGSNSVNVFLGLGLSWVIGAIYWPAVGATKDWVSRVRCVSSAKSAPLLSRPPTRKPPGCSPSHASDPRAPPPPFRRNAPGPPLPSGRLQKRLLLRTCGRARL